MTVRGFIPPEGPQNVHGVRHQYNEGQGSHRFQRAVIYSPEEIVLTGVQTAWNELERLGLEEVPEEVAAECHSIYQAEDPDRTIQEVLDDWRSEDEETDEEEAEAETEEVEESAEEDGEESEEPEGSAEGTDEEDEEDHLGDIPEDLESLDYREELLPLAQTTGAVEEAESRSTEDLISTLEEMRDD
jgi:hypothetical protein